jgi:hypothetical protein
MPRVSENPTRDTVPDVARSVSAELLDDFAHDIGALLDQLDETSTALRVLVASMSREADRAKAPRVP